MTQDRPLLGISLMLAFCFLIPWGDALAKILGPVFPIGMLVFTRFLFQAVLLIPVAILTKRNWRLRGRLFWCALLRTLLQIAGIWFMFSALRYLPLADAVAIAFVMPFIMLLLGKFLLGEEVGQRRLLACVAGFIGTLLVVQPSFAVFGWPALYPLAVAVIFAVFMLITRQIAKETDPIGLQGLNGLMGVAILLPLLLAGTRIGYGPLSLVPPLPPYIWQLICLGLVGTIAHLFMTWSLRYAPSSTLAPMQYLEIPIATAYGYILFNDFPNTIAATGIAITLAAGSYIVLRERATMRQTPEGSH